MDNQLNFGKIILRPMEPEDIDLLYIWENNSDIWELSNTRTPFSKFILKKYISNSYKDIYETKQLRLIIGNRSQRPLGAIDLFDFEPYHLRAGVGILIHRSEDHNLGYAADALAALSDYALKTLGLKQIYANIAADNESSIALFRKSGFVEAGLKKYWLKTFTGWKDEILFQKILG
jgi:diamine N-acetyltransferase